MALCTTSKIRFDASAIVRWIRVRSRGSQRNFRLEHVHCHSAANTHTHTVPQRFGAAKEQVRSPSEERSCVRRATVAYHSVRCARAFAARQRSLFAQGEHVSPARQSQPLGPVSRCCTVAGNGASRKREQERKSTRGKCNCRNSPVKGLLIGPSFQPSLSESTAFSR